LKLVDDITHRTDTDARRALAALDALQIPKLAVDLRVVILVVAMLDLGIRLHELGVY